MSTQRLVSGARSAAISRLAYGDDGRARTVGQVDTVDAARGQIQGQQRFEHRDSSLL
ncbi:hypothetical protein [Nocardia stercoris]|uniref:hypothetical protein n=1 Tax=Nocardia stercoris TaxID=2483361 RepID=UPI001F2B8741|nr:hypothetical protein [Nocardia stercoris]